MATGEHQQALRAQEMETNGVGWVFLSLQRESSGSAPVLMQYGFGMGRYPRVGNVIHPGLPTPTPPPPPIPDCSENRTPSVPAAPAGGGSTAPGRPLPCRNRSWQQNCPCSSKEEGGNMARQPSAWPPSCHVFGEGGPLEAAGTVAPTCAPAQPPQSPRTPSACRWMSTQCCEGMRSGLWVGEGPRGICSTGVPIPAPPPTERLPGHGRR